jgi:hypothetical protein
MDKGAPGTIKDVQKLTGFMAAPNNLMTWRIGVTLLQALEVAGQVLLDRGGRAGTDTSQASSAITTHPCGSTPGENLLLFITMITH